MSSVSDSPVESSEVSELKCSCKIHIVSMNNEAHLCISIGFKSEKWLDIV